MTATPPFRLDFRSTNGRLAGPLQDADGGGDLFEYTTWLRVRSDVPGYVAPAAAPGDDDVTGFVPPVFMTDGLAVMTVARSHDDCGGKSIGMFRHGVGAEELEQLRRLVELTPWSELPRPVGGQFTAPQLELSYSSGEMMIQRKYNATCGEFRAAIRPLENALDELASRLMAHPISVLGLEGSAAPEPAEPEGSDHWTIHMKLRNRGMLPIVFTDPRIPQGAADPHVLDNQPRFELRIGEIESNAGVPPSEWTVLPLPPVPADAPQSRVLAGGSCLELSVPWTAPRPGKFLLAATWQDYGGPIEAVAGQLPFMPLPESGSSALVGGPYPVRGATFANHVIEVSPNAKGEKNR